MGDACKKVVRHLASHREKIVVGILLMLFEYGISQTSTLVTMSRAEYGDIAIFLSESLIGVAGILFICSGIGDYKNLLFSEGIL